MSAHATAAVEQPVATPGPTPRAGWTQIPRPFLDAAPLDNDRLAHVLLISYAWDEDECHPYQADLAAELGCSTRTVKRRTSDLRRAALITVTRVAAATPTFTTSPPRRRGTTRPAMRRSPTPCSAIPR